MSNAKRIVMGGMSAVLAVLLLAALLLAVAAPQQVVMAQAPLGTIGVPYTQNFNSLANSGTNNPWTNNSTLTGWYAAQQNGTLSTYRADNGSSNTGALYSYGSTGETERALGSVSSGTPGTIYYGVRLENNTGVAITALDIAYTGEQWRNGGNTNQQKLAFAYQVGDNLTNLTTGSWTAVSTLDFTGPITGSTASALDGNAAANRVAISGTINVLIMPGQEIMLRWMDINDSGNDHGLAIDDLSVTPRTDVVLTASKAVTPTTDVPYQGVVTYTVALRNWGGISDTVLFTDTLPAEVDFSAWIQQPAGASVTNDEITWSGTLTASTALTFSFTAVHVGNYGDVVTNTATFSGTHDAGTARATFSVERLTSDVTFIYHDLEDVVRTGEAVYLAGDFNSWSPTATLMTADAGLTVFSATIPALNVGQAYGYKYVVWDGANRQWDWLNTANRTITVTSGLDTVDDYRNVIVGWANLQWPYTLLTNYNTATDPVYGRVYIYNVTNPTGEGRGIRAQVGYGNSTDPATWTWFPMTYNTDNGNNDEFMGVMTPTVGGVYSYTTRFDGNWGAGNPNAGWIYGDIDGYDPFGSGDPFELSQTGVLTSVLYDVAVSKTALLNEAVVHDGAGALVSYTLSIENRSTITPTSNITLTDVLPTGFEYVSDDSGVTSTGSGSGADPLTWVFTDTLQPGETISFTLVLSATDAITASGRYTDTAAIQIAGGDWVPANDTASAGVTVYRVIPISQARGLPAGTLVAVEGTVTAEPGIFKETNPPQSRKLYLQDDTGGVLVYLATGLNPVARHNRVRVVGTMGEYRTETEVLPLNAASVVDLGPDTPITPLPLATGAVDESVEGQLVRVSGYIVAKPYAYVLRINDGSGNVDIYRYINLGNTSDPNYIDFTPYAVGDYVVVTGTTRGYDYSGTVRREVLPRGPADIVELYPVTFVYHDLEDVVHTGEDVHLRGEFNGWGTSPITMAHDANYTVFTATVILENPGTYAYKYYVPAAGDPGGWDLLNTNNRSVTVTAPQRVDDYRNVVVGWAILQWPPSITINLGQSTGNIYGRLYISNVTNPTGEGRGILAQVGYGNSTDPATWTWFPMTYNTDDGNNDEFMGAFIPTAGGVYSYAVRFDGNWGAGNPNAGWAYGDLDGYVPGGDPFELSQAGVLTVRTPDLSASSKTVAPTGQVLPGSLLTYTISLVNASGTTVTTATVHLTDTLPAEVALVTATLPAGMTYDPGTHTLYWNGEVGVGKTVDLTFQVQAPPLASLSLGTHTFHNTVTVADGYGVVLTRHSPDTTVRVYGGYLPLVARRYP